MTKYLKVLITNFDIKKVNCTNSKTEWTSGGPIHLRHSVRPGNLPSFTRSVYIELHILVYFQKLHNVYKYTYK